MGRELDATRPQRICFAWFYNLRLDIFFLSSSWLLRSCFTKLTDISNFGDLIGSIFFLGRFYISCDLVR